MGHIGTSDCRWSQVAQEESAALRQRVARLQSQGAVSEAARIQQQLVDVSKSYLPDQMPPARRALARMLTRAGRFDHALRVMTQALRHRDGEDYYCAALIAIRAGNVTSARRWVNEGRAWASDDELLVCLDDIAHDLDQQAVFTAARQSLRDPSGARPVAHQFAGALVAPRRSYLVEILVEETFGQLDVDDSCRLLDALAAVPDVGIDACHACAAVLTGPAGDYAIALAEPRTVGRDWVAGLAHTAPISAWATSPDEAQQQLVICLRRESGRVGILVALRDHARMDGAVKDAFFLPDVAEPRVAHEMHLPMAEIGTPLHNEPLPAALDQLEQGLCAADAMGWELPSLGRQPVRTRIARCVLPAHLY